MPKALHLRIAFLMTTRENHLVILVPSGKIVCHFPSICSQFVLKPHADFLVTDLPNVTIPLNRNWAGSIPVNRANHPNDTLFFWAFESQNGSLTAAANESSTEPWGIWLNGGSVSSSLV